MLKNKIYFTMAVFLLAVIFTAYDVSAASADILSWPLAPFKAFFSSADYLAHEILDSFSTKQPKNNFKNMQPVYSGADKKNVAGGLLTLDFIDYAGLKKAIESSDKAESANKTAAPDIQMFNKKLETFEKLYDEMFCDIAGLSNRSSNNSGEVAPSPPAQAMEFNKIISETPLAEIKISDAGVKNDNQNESRADTSPASLVSSLKSLDANSLQFKSIFEKFKEDLKPETESYISRLAAHGNSRNVDSAPETKNPGKMLEEMLSNKMPFPLNLKNDPLIAQNVLATAKNEMFDKITLNCGTVNFGWTNIAFDRGGGLSRAGEIAVAFRLKDREGAVRDFILETVKSARSEEMIRKRNGLLVRRVIYVRAAFNKRIKVVVDNGEERIGTIVTAFVAPDSHELPAEIARRIEEANEKTEFASKNAGDEFKNENPLNQSFPAVVIASSSGAEFRSCGAKLFGAGSGEVMLKNQLVNAYAGARSEADFDGYSPIGLSSLSEAGGLKSHASIYDSAVSHGASFENRVRAGRSYGFKSETKEFSLGVRSGIYALSSAAGNRNKMQRNVYDNKKTSGANAEENIKTSINESKNALLIFFNW